MVALRVGEVEGRLKREEFQQIWYDKEVEPYEMELLEQRRELTSS